MAVTKYIGQLPNATDLTRFWSRIDKNGPIPEHMPHLGPCWVWTAGKTKGYGQFYINSLAVSAHVLAWVIENGPVPLGMCICHKCDHPSCCRAEHLFAGTARDNFDDAVKKGRIVALKGDRTRPERRLRGERNAAAKLTEDKVRQIRILIASGKSTRSIAKEFNVWPGTIRFIKQGHIWKHV